MIDPRAIVDPSARLGENVRIGPWSIIGPDVEIGDDCEIDAHVIVRGPTIMERGNRIFPFAVVGAGHSGAGLRRRADPVADRRPQRHPRGRDPAPGAGPGPGRDPDRQPQPADGLCPRGARLRGR
ncbi:MAG: hypothetical protein U5R48_12870 [Gammaproteobacteria bacterium]|nr:hypothetical protein [Gammaproteobacteria bacterium]